MELGQKRAITAIMARQVSLFFKITNQEFGLDTTNFMILCAICSRSIQQFKADQFLIRQFGGEDNALPTAERQPIYINELSADLGMSRETLRRRLEQLVAEGLVKKVQRGYVFVAQIGPDDRTAGVRTEGLKLAADFKTSLARLGM